MTLQILTFGIARDIVGSSTLAFETDDSTTVEGLKKQLFERYPRFGDLRSLLIAVNSEYGGEDKILREKDEIALIPPVSGG
jgi:molybdopterin synthase sulfur carrier subunit